MNINPILSNAGLWIPIQDSSILSSKFQGALAGGFHALVPMANGSYGIILNGWGYSGWPPSLTQPAKVTVAFIAPNAAGQYALRTGDFLDDPVTNGGHALIVADFNADGLADIVLPAHNESPFVPMQSVAYMAKPTGGFTKVLVPDLQMAHDAQLVTIGGKPAILTSTFTSDAQGNKQPGAMGNSIITYENGGFVVAQPPVLGSLPGMDAIIISSGAAGQQMARGDVGDAWVPGTTYWNRQDIEIYAFNGRDATSAKPIQVITPYLATLPQYKDFPAQIGGPGRAHVYRLWTLDLNKDGYGDILAGQSMWSQTAANFPSALQLLLNKGDGSFVDATPKLNPDMSLDTAEMDYNPQFIDLDGSGIETLLFGGSFSYGSMARQSDYVLLNDGTGRLHIGLHSEFFGLAEKVLKFLNLPVGPTESPPRFIAVPQPDGSLDFVAEIVTSVRNEAAGTWQSAFRFVNVDLSYNPATDFTRAVTISDRNGSGLMRTWAGDDLIHDLNGAAKARIDGGAGNDMAVYSGRLSDYRVGLNADGSVSVVSRATGIPKVSDTLLRIETLKFADQMVAVNKITTLAADTPTFRLIADDGFAGSVGGSGSVIGTKAAQDISLVARTGAITLDASFNAGGDVLRLPGKAADWTIARSGSSAKLVSEALSVSVPIGTVGIDLVFSDGARKLVYANGAFKIGDQAFADVAAKIIAAGGTAPAIAGTGAAKLILSADAEVAVGGKVQVIGTKAGREIVEALGGTISFDPSFNAGGDTIDMPGTAGSFTATRAGSSMTLAKGADSISIPIGTIGTDLAFDDATRALLYASGQFRIGSQIIEGSGAVGLIG